MFGSIKVSRHSLVLLMFLVLLRNHCFECKHLHEDDSNDENKDVESTLDEIDATEKVGYDVVEEEDGSKSKDPEENPDSWLPPKTAIAEEIDEINKIEGAKGLTDGDILPPTTVNAAADRNENEKRNAVRNRGQIWRTRVIPYHIDRSITSYVRRKITQAIKEFEKKTCLRFKRVSTSTREHYIKFFRGRGCYSSVGKTRRRFQLVSIGYRCGRYGTIIHEIMHALGFYHEHSRYDRDKYIKIQFSNILPGTDLNFKKNRIQDMTTLGLPYDYDGVMHYGAFAFTKNFRSPTIIKLGKGGHIGQRRGFSKTDLLQINALYDCKKRIADVVQVQVDTGRKEDLGLAPLVHVVFADDVITLSREEAEEAEEASADDDVPASTDGSATKEVEKYQVEDEENPEEVKKESTVDDPSKSDPKEVSDDISKSDPKKVSKDTAPVAEEEDESKSKDPEENPDSWLPPKTAIAEEIDEINKIEGAKGLTDGDILPPTTVNAAADRNENEKRNAVRNRGQIWRTRVIPYHIDRSIPSYVRRKITQAIKEFEKKTCLRFKGVSTYTREHYIKFFRGRGCYSSVGKTRGRYQPVSIGYRCGRYGTIIHEIMHALGFYHEHSRYDRDKYIKIQFSNILPGTDLNFKKNRIQDMTTLGLPYDYDGVMHYGAYAFTKNFRSPTIIKLGKGGHIGQRRGFSKTDLLQINALYDCKTSSAYNDWSSWSNWSPCIDYGLGRKEYSQRFCFRENRKLCPGAGRYGTQRRSRSCTSDDVITLSREEAEEAEEASADDDVPASTDGSATKEVEEYQIEVEKDS
eukprot:gene16268-7652_t